MFTKIKVILYSVFIVFISYNVYLASFFVRNGEMHFINDIGRDFLLLQELDQKKIVLIGARSNASGVFHGPLWTYLNYPAYLIGHGNPVTIGWFWILLGVVFLITTFYILKNLLNTFSAFLGTMLLSVILISNSNDIVGQEAAFYFMPFFLFTIYKFVETKRLLFLVLHLITVGIFIQFNIGVGALFAMLSVGLSIFLIVKEKKWKYLYSFLILPLTLMNFLVFDLRHGFSLSKALFRIGGSSKFLLPIGVWLQNRYDHLISMQIPTTEGHVIPLLLFLAVITFTFLEIKSSGKYKNLILLISFYYLGYFVLSYFNKGIMLIDYVHLLIPLSVIWIAALAESKFKIIFVPIILLIIFQNIGYANVYLNNGKQNYIGKWRDSWVSLSNVAKSIVKEENGKEFGYFVYSPDAFAYQQRYAMIYEFKTNNSNASEYAKKPITFIIASPPPIDKPYMKEDWWIKNEARISNIPVEKKIFPSGYIVYKYNLNESDQKIPYDPNIDLGLHFR